MSDHTHQMGPWWGPFSGGKYLRGCASCPEVEWTDHRPACGLADGGVTAENLCAEVLQQLLGPAADTTAGWSTPGAFLLDDDALAILAAQPGYRAALKARGYVLVRGDVCDAVGLGEWDPAK